MKKIVQSLVALFLASSSYAQFNPFAPWMPDTNPTNPLIRSSSESSQSPSFQELVDAFELYWKDKDPSQRGSGYKPFRRWQEFWQNCLNPDGTLIQYSQIQEAIARSGDTSKDRDGGNWKPLGPTDFLTRNSSNANLGRLNAITIDPNNPQIYYAGAPAGGLWKSMDAGQSWIPLTDMLPQIGVSAIAVDPLDSQTIYIGTGDDDAFDTYSIGVLKSVDGGKSWNTTGLVFDTTDNTIGEIYLERTNDLNEVYVSSSAGFFKSEDGGESFTLTLEAKLNDIKLKPNNSNIIYAVSQDTFYRSEDNGDTFTAITTGLPEESGRLVLDVTPAAADYVYVLSAKSSEDREDRFGFQGLYKSIDSGLTFEKTKNETNIFESTQAWYDLAIAVSDTDPDTVYTGVLNIWKTSDGGDSFTQINEWYLRNATYTHADIHFLRFFDGVLYCGSDGGFYRSDDDGKTFTDLTKGMNISQFYRIAVSNQNSKKMAGGTQDNGSFGLTESGQWNVYGGGDGMDSAIDPQNEDLYFGFMQFGQNLWYSDNAARSQALRVAKPEKAVGRWITPIEINANREVFAGYDALYKLSGTNFIKVSDTLSQSIYDLETSPVNPDIIYFSVKDTLYKSMDNGQNYDEIAVETFAESRIIDIEAHNSDAKTLFVVTAGTEGKIYKSTDGGVSFKDITMNLPKIPKLDIEHQGGHTANPLFLSTITGVYRIDDTQKRWVLFSKNLPNSPVPDLEINPIEGIITAATYGRGIWQSKIEMQDIANDIALQAIKTPATESFCDGNLGVYSVIVKNNGAQTIEKVLISYNINRSDSKTISWEGSILPKATATIDLTGITTTVGLNVLEIETTVANDAFSENNKRFINIIKNAKGTPNVVQEFEDASDALLTYDKGFLGKIWERGIPKGQVLQQAVSGKNVYATNLDGNYADNTTGYLVSGCYDLSTIEAPLLKFDMAFILEEDWDYINVEYSTDEGETWDVLGTKDDPNWYNSDQLPNPENCYNCVGAQWTGAVTEFNNYSYNLSDFADQTNFVFRFNFVSDGYTNEEGVVIDNLHVGSADILSVRGPKKLSEAAFKIYPNPSKQLFHMQYDTAKDISYEVFDVTGRKLIYKSGRDTTQPKNIIDLSGFDTGIYFIKTKIDGIEFHNKLIKNGH